MRGKLTVLENGLLNFISSLEKLGEEILGLGISFLFFLCFELLCDSLGLTSLKNIIQAMRLTLTSPVITWVLMVATNLLKRDKYQMCVSR